jgi:hypothetical protein
MSGTSLDPKQVVSMEELLISQIIQTEAFTRLLIENGVFTNNEFLDMVTKVDRERRKGR